MSGTDYDSIVNEYEDVNERSDRTCIFVPTAKHYLGDIRGLKILDLACGTGCLFAITIMRKRHMRELFWGLVLVVCSGCLLKRVKMRMRVIQGVIGMSL